MTDNFFIELDNYEGFYFPGQTVTGRVVRIVAETEGQIKYFRLNFKGVATANWTTPLYTGKVVLYIPHSNQETYFDDVIQLNEQSDGASINSLPPGRHSFPFVYHLPPDIPASYNATSDPDLRIYYQVEATFCLEGFWKSKMKAIVTFKVERPIDLNFYPWAAEPNVLEGEKYLCCCCCKSGPISFKLKFNKTGFIIGEKIQFLAKLVNNTHQDIETVEVWISRTVTFKASDETERSDMWREQLGPRFNLRGIPARQKIEVPVNLNMIPDHTQINSFGCSFMNSIYEFHIRMAIPCGVDLKGKIPIAIGVVPFVIQTGRPD